MSGKTDGEGERPLLATPTKFTPVAGSAEGITKLNAFDHALLAAGIGNLNLLRVSSILPPGARQVDKLEIAPGSLVPTAYGSIVSDHPGELISAAVAVGIGPGESYGVIMEFSGHCSKAEAEKSVAAMVHEAFRARGLKLEKCVMKATEHRVEKIGCAFAAVALWY